MNAKPVPKIAAVGTAGVAATLLVTLAQALGVHLSPELASAIVAVVLFAAGYLKKGATP